MASSIETAESAHARLTASFEAGITQPVAYRRDQLKKLLHFLNRHEAMAAEAAFQDMRAPLGFSALTLALACKDISCFLKSLNRLTKPKCVSRQIIAPLYNIPTPKGVVLVFGPYNFSIVLTIRPLIAAIAAGNCVVVKPSEYMPAAQAFCQQLTNVLNPASFAIVTGDVSVAQNLMQLPWGHVLFTGSAPTGKRILEAAAKTLTPVTLELGGKCPAVVLRDADLSSAALAITKARFTNAGQICLAPVCLSLSYTL